MDERPDEIQEHIHRTRGNLNRNLDEPKNRARSAFDWRARFEERPLTMLSVALGGGMLAAVLIPRRRRSRYGDYVEATRRIARQAGRAVNSSKEWVNRQASNTTHDAFDTIKSALLSGAAAKIGSMLGQWVNRHAEDLTDIGRSYQRKARERYEDMASKRTH